MRRIATSTRRLDLAHVPGRAQRQDPSVCLFCQHHQAARASPRATFSTTTRKTAASDSPWLERTLNRTRQKIWGTDKPPGADDPYTGRSFAKTQEVASSGSEGLNGQTADDVRIYEEQARREEKEILQAAIDEAPSHEAYVPANTWDGLERVGGEKEWDNGKQFRGFIPEHKLVSPEEITVAIYRSIVEVFAATWAGRELKRLPRVAEGALVSEALQVRMKPSDDGEGVELFFPNEQVRKAILGENRRIPAASDVGSTVSIRGLEDVEVGAVVETPAIVEDHGFEAQAAADYTTDSLKRTIQSWGRYWTHVSLDHSVIKFAVVRRVMELTGLHIPDPLIHKTQSAAFLISELTRPKAAATTYEALVRNERLSGLKNVTFSPRRVTPIDKEKKVGRWKVIEAELRKRNLPIAGHSYA